MFHSLRIETRENSLIGFQNDHCYTAFTTPNLTACRSDSYAGFDEPIIEIKTPQLNQQVPVSKKITILEQQILPKGRKIPIQTNEAVILKGNDIINKPLQNIKSKDKHGSKESLHGDENVESSSISSSGDSVPDRDSDSDYKDSKDKTSPIKLKRSRNKPRILKTSKVVKAKHEFNTKILKSNKVSKKEIKEKLLQKNVLESKKIDSPKIVPHVTQISNEQRKETPKHIPKLLKKEKKTPSHVTALLSDMTTLFSSPDVIRRVSTDAKTPSANRKSTDAKIVENNDQKSNVAVHVKEKIKTTKLQGKNVSKDKTDKETKSFDTMPQIDDVSLAQILQDPPSVKTQPINPNLIKETFSTANTNSPGMAGPLSPTLDLLGSLQPEEEGLTEDILMHVAQLVESSENLQEVIDKQVLGKVDTGTIKPNTQYQQAAVSFTQTPPTKINKPIEIVRRDGRVITLPPIEAPATRASKRKSALNTEVLPAPVPAPAPAPAPIPVPTSVPVVTSKPVAKKVINKTEPALSAIEIPVEADNKISIDTEDSLNSEDDPNRYFFKLHVYVVISSLSLSLFYHLSTWL